MEPSPHSLDSLQRLAVRLMAVLVLVTFLGTNAQALLWQSSEWLISTVLPAVVVELTNDERTALAAEPLRRNPLLDAAATAKAEHMAQNSYFAHFAPDGTTPWDFFHDVDYRYAHAGENLAIHFTDSREVVAAWMDSPAHRDNIVDSRFREIGVGTARGTYEGFETVFVVQLFGTPARVTPPPRPTTPVAASATTSPVAVAEPAVTTAAPLPVAVREESRTPETGPVSAGEPAARAVEPATPETSATPPIVLPAATPTTSQTLPTPGDTPSTEEPPRLAIESDGTVRLERTLLTDSSGLPPAPLAPLATADTAAGTTLVAAVTQPQTVLQAVYATLSLVIVGLLVTSIVRERRLAHRRQVAYGCLLLGLMGGLGYLHLALTAGAVIA